MKSVDSVFHTYAMSLACWAKKAHLAFARLLEILADEESHVTMSHQGRQVALQEEIVESPTDMERFE